MKESTMINGILQMYGAITAFILLAGHFFRKRQRALKNQCFYWMVFADMSMMFFGGLSYLLSTEENYPLNLMSLLSTVNYFALLGLYCLYIYFLVREYREISALPVIIAIGFCVAGGIGWGISSYNNMFYTDAGRSMAARSTMYWVGQVFGLVPIFIGLILLGMSLKYLGKVTVAILSTVMLFPLLVQYIPASPDVQFRYPATTCSLFLCYATLQMEEERKGIELETTLLEARLFLLRSQLKPHFLNNVLTTIYYLCDKDPEGAAEAMNYLSDYLETNLQDTGQYGEIPFTEELNQLKSYLYLEKLRFGDRLTVNMDIRFRDFTLPSMTLQPIVENSVKHGVSRKVDGGTVTIHTEKKENMVEIIVSDNGVGFENKAGTGKDRRENTDTRDSEQGYLHLGLRNVEERLRVISGGTLRVDSTRGTGTTVTIRIPKA